MKTKLVKEIALALHTETRPTRQKATFSDCYVIDGGSHWQIKRDRKLIFTIEKSAPNEPKRWIESRLAAGDYNV